jgi:hypothetical protein
MLDVGPLVGMAHRSTRKRNIAACDHPHRRWVTLPRQSCTAPAHTSHTTSHRDAVAPNTSVPHFDSKAIIEDSWSYAICPTPSPLPPIGTTVRILSFCQPMVRRRRWRVDFLAVRHGAQSEGSSGIRCHCWARHSAVSQCPTGFALSIAPAAPNLR